MKELVLLNQVETGKMSGRKETEVLQLSLLCKRNLGGVLGRRVLKHWHMAIRGRSLIML